MPNTGGLTPYTLRPIPYTLTIQTMSNISYKHFTLGIEEEYMVMDPTTKELKSHEQKIVHEGQKMIKDKVKAELHQAGVEVGTDICADIEEAYSDVSILRKTISDIADGL